LERSKTAEASSVVAKKAEAASVRAKKAEATGNKKAEEKPVLGAAGQTFSQICEDKSVENVDLHAGSLPQKANRKKKSPAAPDAPAAVDLNRRGARPGAPDTPVEPVKPERKHTAPGRNICCVLL
jgi:hypothetical protein